MASVLILQTAPPVQGASPHRLGTRQKRRVMCTLQIHLIAHRKKTSNASLDVLIQGTPPSWVLSHFIPLLWCLTAQVTDIPATRARMLRAETRITFESILEGRIWSWNKIGKEVLAERRRQQKERRGKEKCQVRCNMFESSTKNRGHLI